MKRRLCRRAALIAPRTASSVAPVPIGYGHSLRPCLGTTNAPQRRATFHQTLLGVGPEQVGSADGRLSAEGCVSASMVVVPEPAVKGCGEFLA